MCHKASCHRNGNYYSCVAVCVYMHLQSHHIARKNIVNQAKLVQATTIHRCCNYTHCLKGAVISKTLCPAHSGQLHSRRVSIKIFTGTEILVKWKDPSDKFPHYSPHHIKMLHTWYSGGSDSLPCLKLHPDSAVLSAVQPYRFPEAVRRRLQKGVKEVSLKIKKTTIIYPLVHVSY